MIKWKIIEKNKHKQFWFHSTFSQFILHIFTYYIVTCAIIQQIWCIAQMPWDTKILNQSQVPSRQPSRHLSFTLLQSNIGLPSLALTLLCSRHSHCENSFCDDNLTGSSLILEIKTEDVNDNCTETPTLFWGTESTVSLYETDTETYSTAKSLAQNEHG